MYWSIGRAEMWSDWGGMLEVVLHELVDECHFESAELKFVSPARHLCSLTQLGLHLQPTGRKLAETGQKLRYILGN